ncbi:MAG: DNA recombination protein RmuC [Proteobacteria bacterium]|nr:DNA recombination protein RmuC [Pseudomonadota bacterium]
MIDYLILTGLGLNLALLLLSRRSNAVSQLQASLERLERSLKEDFRLNRDEFNKISKDNRDELLGQLQTFRRDLIDTQHKVMLSTEKKLDEMRATVDEKLQKTLNERLGQSFATVSKQLEAVQLGLGEMRSLAQDVGGLKNVLSNVKMRGGIGEIQLAMLLEQILAPNQFEANVKTKPGSREVVEFALKLPGKDVTLSQVWLPIDAKFPKDVYEQLLEAYDSGVTSQIDLAQKNLETTIRSMAKDIYQKYVEPPYTTDFAIMFLPFEGIYAEVVRKASLLEELQGKYKIIVTGPTTLAAILNSLQIGFRTLAIQKRTGEVWSVLGNVKAEFDKFSSLLSKAQNNFQSGMKNLDEVMGVRTRAIQRSLQEVDDSAQVPDKLD